MCAATGRTPNRRSPAAVSRPGRCESSFLYPRLGRSAGQAAEHQEKWCVCVCVCCNNMHCNIISSPSRVPPHARWSSPAGRFDRKSHLVDCQGHETGSPIVPFVALSHTFCTLVPHLRQFLVLSLSWSPMFGRQGQKVIPLRILFLLLPRGHGL